MCVKFLASTFYFSKRFREEFGKGNSLKHKVGIFTMNHSKKRKKTKKEAIFYSEPWFHEIILAQRILDWYKEK